MFLKPCSRVHHTHMRFPPRTQQLWLLFSPLWSDLLCNEMAQEHDGESRCLASQQLTSVQLSALSRLPACRLEERTWHRKRSRHTLKRRALGGGGAWPNNTGAKEGHETPRGAMKGVLQKRNEERHLQKQIYKQI